MSNPLTENLKAQAGDIKNVADTVIQQIEVETLQNYLPELLNKLTQKERSVIEMKFFKEFSGVEIADILEVSEGRGKSDHPIRIDETWQSIFTYS